MQYLQGLPRECIFFEKSFRVPKVTPKVVPKIIDALALKIIILIRIKSRHSIVVVLVRFDRVFMFAVSQCATNHLYQLAQLADLLMVQAFVDSIAIDEILLQNTVCPLAELYTSLAFHTIAYGDDDIKIVERDRLLNSISV